ncbi:BTAD domain-containing putative transcriptional regulator [Nocardioides sp. J54]|uniref:BTAD domain-containing putative transcriptional regulator n=1 Tax=Nocardioides sp. J54 TaxID=935866 RepID=UPI0004B50975|nr:BTAD domain-containing putative transcriptional regulator [Nocardioides sp. J54]
MQLTGKQRVLLAHLVAAAGDAVPVPALVDALALGASSDPRHALEAHVSRLRSRLGRPVARRSAGYALVLDQVECDAWLFDELCSTARAGAASGDLDSASAAWTEALGLWRGRAHAGLDDHPALALEAARLESAYDAAVAGWVDVQLLLGNHRAAADRLEGMLAEHPLREQHWGRLIAAQHAAGHLGEALATYDRARRTIGEALGIRPGRRLNTLHNAVLHERPVDQVVRLAVDPDLARRSVPSSTSSSTSSSTPAPPPPPLVGRGDEMVALLDALTASRDGFQSVTVTGDAGIGKTALVRAFAHRASAACVEVHAGRCSPGGPTGFDPIREVLRRDLEHVTSAVRLRRLGPRGRHLVPLVADLLPGEDLDAEARPHQRHGDLDAGRLQVFEAFAAWLGERARAGQVCLVVEDLHWADEETLDLLAHVSRTAGPGVLLVTTWRDREPADQTPDERRVPPELGGRRVRLGKLDAAACEALLDAELAALVPPRPLPPDVRSTMLDRSGGHPLYLVELARHWHAHGTPDFPPSLLATVARRLGAFPPAVRSVLLDAAAVGSSFDRATLAAVADAESVREALEVATYARVVESVPGRTDWFRFTHELLRVALTHDQSADDLARRRGRIAAAWDGWRTAESAFGVAEVGRHLAASFQGGSGAQAADYLAQAGDQAMRQHAPFVALGLYREALSALGDAAPPDLASDLHRGLGLAQLRTGDPAFRETLLHAARLAAAADDLGLLTAAVVANSRGWYSDLGGVDAERLAMTEQALAAAPSEPANRALLLSSWAVESVRDHARAAEVLARSAEALAIGERVGDGHLLAELLTAHYTVTHSRFADPRGCVDLSDRLLRLANELDDAGWRLNALVQRVQSHFQTGALRIVDEALPAGIALAIALRSPARHWMLTSWQAMSSLLHGRLDDAEAQLTEAVGLGSTTGQPDAMDWFLGQMFLLRWMGGRLDEIIAVVEDQADELAARLPVWRAGLAMARAETGDDAGATTLLDAMVADPEDLPRDMLWLPGQCFWARAAVLSAHARAAAELYPALLPYAGLIAHNGTVDAGPVDVHLAHLADLLGDPQAADEHRSAAAQWCAAEDVPLWAARCDDPRGR